MEPGRVLRNVQIELRRMGYYRGAIDGLIGPMTRSALTRFQRDNGLPVTRRIDGPTLASLGLV
ncbi:MAG: peptidoglycan-binding protein [Chthoniobacterales bacterium]|nr:peptidoglycan-binding protein [Chthoniobacterales bacterium]